MLTVQVWDRSLVGAVEKAIRDAGLGLNPAADGQLVRVPITSVHGKRHHLVRAVALEVPLERIELPPSAS